MTATHTDGGLPFTGGDVDRGHRLLTELRDLLAEAAADPEISRRLARADTTVRFMLAEDEGVAITALLDRNPVEVTDVGVSSTVEIEIVLPEQVLGRLFQSDFHLAMAIVRGEVTFRGPVRKLLLVLPILQHLAEAKGLHETHDDQASGRCAVGAA